MFICLNYRVFGATIRLSGSSDGHKFYVESRIFRCTVATRIALSFPIKLNLFCRHHNLHCRQRKGHFVGDDGKKQDNHTDFEHCRQRKGYFVGDDEIAVGTAALRLICVCRSRNYLIISCRLWRWADESLGILRYTMMCS